MRRSEHWWITKRPNRRTTEKRRDHDRGSLFESDRSLRRHRRIHYHVAEPGANGDCLPAEWIIHPLRRYRGTWRFARKLLRDVLRTAPAGRMSVSGVISLGSNGPPAS